MSNHTQVYEKIKKYKLLALIILLKILRYKI